MLYLLERPRELGEGAARAVDAAPKLAVDAVDFLLDTKVFFVFGFLWGVFCCLLLRLRPTACVVQDGLVARKRDPACCQHGDGGQCLHCMPLDPWDPVVLQANDPPIKHLSFHSYLRMLCNGADRGRLVNLEDLRCTVKESCYGHAPWPEGYTYTVLFLFDNFLVNFNASQVFAPSVSPAL
jgi:hypothetical protein